VINPRQKDRYEESLKGMENVKVVKLNSLAEAAA
jgi:hypothetical protein